MKYATVKQNGEETLAVINGLQAILMKDINKQTQMSWPCELFELIQTGQLQAFSSWFNSEGKTLLSDASFVSKKAFTYGPLYRHPRKIWGIGLNYVEHASDLSEKAPSTEPASFMKPDTTIIGINDDIEIPIQSQRTTAESELGIIIGKECKNVSEEEAKAVIAGYTTIIDMTAEDILQVNPRYLTRSKSFDTFFSFGPELVTPDEIEDVNKLNVATIHNNEVHRKNVVSNMTFLPYYLVSFHSKVMTLKPGDIISTGTPGAVPISDGDIVACHIDGFEPLINRVKDLK